jgi:uncharacterized repeat protein (TIGR01451 family)
MKKFILPILLLIIFTPIMVAAEHRYKCAKCADEGISEYFIDNLKIGQEFYTGDIIYRSTPEEELLDDAGTIYHLYPYTETIPWGPGHAYGINCFFDDIELSGSGSFFGFSVGLQSIWNYDYNSNTIIYPSVANIDKNKYWKLEKLEKIAGGEAANLYFKSYNRTINLNIINKVNNLDKYNAKKGEVLMYTIKIKNTGDGYSENNLITTNVPTGLEIDKNRISNNGTYNEEDNIITWNLDELGPESEYTFNYYAKVIDDNITEYVGNSFMTSKQVQEKLNSSNTIVNVEKTINTPITIKNPNTNTSGFLIIAMLLLMISSITFITIKRKNRI